MLSVVRSRVTQTWCRMQGHKRQQTGAIVVRGYVGLGEGFSAGFRVEDNEILTVEILTSSVEPPLD